SSSKLSSHLHQSSANSSGCGMARYSSRRVRRISCFRRASASWYFNQSRRMSCLSVSVRGTRLRSYWAESINLGIALAPNVGGKGLATQHHHAARMATLEEAQHLQLLDRQNEKEATQRARHPPWRMERQLRRLSCLEPKQMKKAQGVPVPD